MTAQPNPGVFAFDNFLVAQEQKSLLRVVTCGSVDDGKSTLIGRLLYESKLVFEDHLAALEVDSRRWGTNGRNLDFALLVDGLAAEREQGITIDVAYRFFSTERRKFIVADTPGHEQYTRNMATGASTADLAVILIDARKKITRQAKRHSLILSMLGVRHVVLALNKMDLVGWDAAVAAEIEAEYRAFARGLAFEEITCIPIAARSGDNIVVRSANMRWYQGPTLLDHLETVEIESAPASGPFRMPVQLVMRRDSEFRGYAGTVASGRIEVGMPIKLWPSGQETRVGRIVSAEGELGAAVSGQPAILTFTDPVDVSRGDMIAAREHPPQIADEIPARIFWMDERALRPGRSYLLKLGTATVSATVRAPLRAFDFDTLSTSEVAELGSNAVGDCVLSCDRPVAFDSYFESRNTGNFILIDRESYDTVGMGLVLPPSDFATKPSRA
jgi:sulfate adenylyltransferase large subunit